jgi:hypothetical protein
LGQEPESEPEPQVEKGAEESAEENIDQEDPNQDEYDPEEMLAAYRYSDVSGDEAEPWVGTARLTNYSESDKGRNANETWILQTKVAHVVPWSQMEDTVMVAARATEMATVPYSSQSRRAIPYVHPQPVRDTELQRMMNVYIKIGGLKANVLLDCGSTTEMVSPEFTRVAKLQPVELVERLGLRLAVKGSSSKLNYGTWAEIDWGLIQAKRYFDIVNIDRYDAILGTPFLWENKITLIFEDEGKILHKVDYSKWS